jgi:hypothetical protein
MVQSPVAGQASSQSPLEHSIVHGAAAQDPVQPPFEQEHVPFGHPTIERAAVSPRGSGTSGPPFGAPPFTLLLVVELEPHATANIRNAATEDTIRIAMSTIILVDQEALLRPSAEAANRASQT